MGTLSDRVVCAMRRTLALTILTTATALVHSGMTGSAIAAVPASVPWTWGDNSYGELGTGGTAPRPTPAAVELNGIIDVHGGREHVVALREDGTVWVWGSNQHGQLGLGGSTNRSTPEQIPGLSGIVAVETGHNHSVALAEDGTLWSWGYNADGQLGDGSTTTRRTPVRVQGVNDAVGIAGGRDMSYAIRSTGTVLGWGRNDEGQLGDGTTVRRTTAIRVGDLTDVVDIAAGRDHGLAVRTDGSVWAWGSNDFGQLGLGNSGAATDRTAPMQVISSGASEVIAGAHHSYALRNDGQVRAWGRNYRANLGDGSTTMRTTPVAVAGLTDVVSIASGRDHGVAVRADGRVLTWGMNSSGQLGDGTTTNRTVPVLVPGLTGANHAGGGGSQYSVVLVPDDEPPPPPPAQVEFVGASQANRNAPHVTLDIPGSVEAGDRLLLAIAANRAAVAVTPTGWTLIETVTDGADMRSWLYTRTAPTGLGGSTVRVDLDNTTKTGAHLLAYRGASSEPTARAMPEGGNTSQHQAPSAPVVSDGSTVIRLWADKLSTPHQWSLPSDYIARGSTQGTGGGLITTVVGELAGHPFGTAPSVTASAGTSSAKAVAWTIVLAP